jgi:hypothetical protein
MMNDYDGRVRKKMAHDSDGDGCAAAASVTYIVSQHVFEGEGVHGLGHTEKTASTASLFGLTIRMFCHCGCCHSLNNLRSSCIIVIIAADYNAPSAT